MIGCCQRNQVFCPINAYFSDFKPLCVEENILYWKWKWKIDSQDGIVECVRVLMDHVLHAHVHGMVCTWCADGLHASNPDTDVG